MLSYKSQTFYNGHSYAEIFCSFKGTEEEFLRFMCRVHGKPTFLPDGRIKYIDTGLVADVVIFITLHQTGD